MKTILLRAILPLLLLSMALPAAQVLAQNTPKCDGAVNGFTLIVIPDHSGVGSSEVICNYSAQNADKTAGAGLAITVDYGCPDAIKAAWASKTSEQPKWDPNASPPVMAGEISRSSNSLLLREDLGPYSGFAGDFTVEEKLFLLLDSQTTATVFVMTDVKQPKNPSDSNKPDPKVLNLSADQASALAGTIAAAHRSLVSQLQCTSAIPTSPSQFPAPPPVLAKIATIDNMSISIKRYSPNGFPTEWQKRVGKGVELHYGDTFCFAGTGTVQLTWYDGSTISFSDPNELGKRGKFTECFEINLKRPEDMTSPGVIRDGATFLLKLVTDATPAVARMAINALTPPPEIEGKDVVLAIKGTTFVIGEDVAAGASLVCTEEHTVHVTPLNPSLAPFDLNAGSQVRVSHDSISPITPGCTLPVDTAIPQPNTNVTGMTLQAARRYVVAGDTLLVPFWLVNAQNLANLNFQISYDPSVIQPAGDLAKGDLIDNALFKANPNQPGSVLVGLAQTSALNGTGTVLNIPFRAVGKPGDVSPLFLAVTTINDPNGGNLQIDRIPGEIALVNADGTFPPVDGGGGNGNGNGGGNTGGGGSNGGTGSGGTGGIQPGDCDGDGHLSELDALCALEMSTAIRPPRLFMDMDGDGSVTSRDAVIILQKAVGQ